MKTVKTNSQKLLERLLAAFMLAAISHFAAADDAADEAAIVQLYADWRSAVETADIASYRAVLADDVRLMPPGGAVIAGADHYEAFLGPVFAGADYRIDVVEPPAVRVLGDVAVAEYRYVIHLSLKNPGQGIDQPGALTASRTDSRYFDVLRRQGDGQWRVWRHLWQPFPAE